MELKKSVIEAKLDLSNYALGLENRQLMTNNLSVTKSSHKGVTTLTDNMQTNFTPPKSATVSDFAADIVRADAVVSRQGIRIQDWVRLYGQAGSQSLRRPQGRHTCESTVLLVIICTEIVSRRTSSSMTRTLRAYPPQR